jgi:hypothetical protein
MPGCRGRTIILFGFVLDDDDDGMCVRDALRGLGRNGTAWMMVVYADVLFGLLVVCGL